jgi:chaperonin GroEL
LDLEKIALSELGSARKVTVTSDNTTLVEGTGKHDKIQARIKQIRQEVETVDSDYDREKLQERLAKLAGGVAQINVVAASEVELKEAKARIEDAMHATRAAIEEGTLPGGGVAYLRARKALDTLKLQGDEALGVQIIKNALEMPIRTIVENAGEEGAVVAMEVNAKDGSYGYDAANGKYGDLYELGIIDPTKVTRTALQNAASVACLLLTADCLISNLPKKDEGKDKGGDMPYDEEMM